MEQFNLPQIIFATKAEIASQANGFAERIIEQGQELDCMVAIASISEFCDKVKSAIKSKAIEKADELCADKSTAEYKGASIQLKETPVAYDFKQVKCITDLEEELKALKLQAKMSTPDRPYLYYKDGKLIDTICGVPKKDKKDDEYTLSIILKK